MFTKNYILTETNGHIKLKLAIELYQEQCRRWPQSGRHILAQYDDESVIVYQAYQPSIGHFAARNGYFGGDFSFSRMSWVKPGFLWMMFRNGWGTKDKQEVTLAIRLKRSAFDDILAEAVPSTYTAALYATEDAWKRALETSDVRMQWDPDHDPSGARLERRAIQLGLRGSILKHYAHDWIIDIEDISDFVQQQRVHALAINPLQLIIPYEKEYLTPYKHIGITDHP
jgi:hypothetical protein